MIISQLKGGLGNMMFQISAGISLAKDLNVDFFYTYKNWNSCTQHNISNYPTTIFKNIKKIDFIPDGLKYYTYDESTYKKVLQEDNLILDGYFQSDKYFSHNKYFIKKVFDVEINEKYKDYCFIHIRRGDYLKFSHVHPVTTDEYYIKALEQINNDKIVILTDDKEYVKNHSLFSKFEVFQSTSDLDDLSVMKSCKQAIIGNSTFSWWGSYLGELEKIIAPKLWFNHLNYDQYKDIYTDKMILI